MKKNSTLILIIAFFLVIAKCTPQKQTVYIVPEQYTGETRVNMIKMLEDGQKLYKLNCSRCHGIFTKGKDSIPNFSKTQIESYSVSALLDDPKNHAVTQKIRPYDLDMILQFLQFRRPPEVK
jgi:cytochrome c553